jgi:NAD(P)-dependent dehydrogenase (short-subunit alcohol dehydrogenase family)
LKTLSEDPSNTIIGLVRDLAATQAQVTADNLKNVHLLTADITAAPALNAAAEKTAKLTNGVVDYLIVNAGYISHDTGFMTPTDYIGKEDFFLKEFDTCMHTNVAGAMFAINAFLPLVKASKIKKVVSISSGHADENCVLAAGAGLATAIPYALSKVALNMLNVKYAVKYKDEGIIFLSLAPGVVLTAAPTLEAGMSEMFLHFCLDPLGRAVTNSAR